MRKKLILVGILTVFMIVLGVCFYFFSLPEDLNSSKQTEILEQKLGRKIKQQTDRYGEQLDFKGKYFELKYPEKAKVDDKKDADRANLTDSYIEYLGLELSSPRVFFLVQVYQTTDPLEDFAAVKLRRLQNDMYKEASQSGFTGLIFTKTQSGGEKSAFVKNKDKVYSFVSSANSQDEAEGFFDKIFPTITLKP